MFPNWGDAGHDTCYEPERVVDLQAGYSGWHGPMGWRSWYTQADAGHRLDLDEALCPFAYPEYGTAYAYTQFVSDRRESAELRIELQDAAKVWLNGNLLIASRSHLRANQVEKLAAPAHVRQGKNTLLVKVSKVPGASHFAIDFASLDEHPLNLKWWM